MDEGKFREIVNGVVSVIGKRLTSQFPELRWNPGWEGRLLAGYDEVRGRIRGQMFSDPDLYDHRIDRHKVASAFTIAVLKARPLTASGSTPSAGARLANETLAFLTGTRIVQLFVTRRLTVGDPTLADRVRKTSIIFPPANEGNYAAHTYKALYNAGHSGLNDFVLANLYFLIESFHLAALHATLPVLPEDAAVISQVI